ncbi:MAG: Glu/Leu/Phe/Val dehydrogenase [Anaerolineaceae bacterium]|nr:MAG: Glu/Leu/Phe/Val dehydrogenase [Anaerolineaceae bacterium]
MKTTFDFLSRCEHEQFCYHHDKQTGLRAFIAVHNTVRGPGLGGTRLWHYDDLDAAALDALRLSEGMTYKAAVAGLPLGGGKAVIVADGREDDPVCRAERFAAFGAFIDKLGGTYITAEDVGTKPSDMVEIRRNTAHVVGLPAEQGGSGDPSPVTAYGCLRGIEALVESVFGCHGLDGVHVAVQGLGKVGLPLVRMLLDAGASVTAADINPDSVAEARAYGADIVTVDAIYDVDCDVFSPCALGATLNDDTIPRLHARIIAGCANNQLAEARHGDLLHEMGIVYGVDYAINAGGLINVYTEIEGYDAERARRRAGEIYHTMHRLMQISEMEGVSMVRSAALLADDALKKVIA